MARSAPSLRPRTLIHTGAQRPPRRCRCTSRLCRRRRRGNRRPCRPPSASEVPVPLMPFFLHRRIRSVSGGSVVFAPYDLGERSVHLGTVRAQRLAAPPVRSPPFPQVAAGLVRTVFPSSMAPPYGSGLRSDAGAQQARSTLGLTLVRRGLRLLRTFPVDRVSQGHATACPRRCLSRFWLSSGHAGVQVSSLLGAGAPTARHGLLGCRGRRI